jgi:AcrR family transcriptional regulator
MASRTQSLQRKSDLAAVAGRLIHQRGYARTSLADIAVAADMPLGSVHFYFPTKEALAAAVMEQRVAAIRARIERWALLSSPRARLTALVDVWVRDRETDTRHGCPVGSLCYELGKDSGSLGALAAAPFRLLLEWCALQFRAMGQGRDARRHALHLLSALQGMGLIANALKDPDVILEEARSIKGWLGSLEPASR